MSPRQYSARNFLMAALVMTILLSTTGCSLLSGGKLQTVPDPSGIYHLKIPGNWTYQSNPGMVSIYADKKLPETGKLEKLSIIIMTSTLGSDKPSLEPTETLRQFTQWRAESSKWKNPKIGRAEKASLGGQRAYRMSVSGTDKNGVPFKGQYYLARAGLQEVLVIAVAPADKWSDSSEDLDASLSKNWYWDVVSQ